MARAKLPRLRSSRGQDGDDRVPARRDLTTCGHFAQRGDHAAAVLSTSAIENSMSAVNAGVVKEVAVGLGNTPAVCRRSYINPAVFIAWQKGSVRRRAARTQPAKALMTLLGQAGRQAGTRVLKPALTAFSMPERFPDGECGKHDSPERPDLAAFQTSAFQLGNGQLVHGCNAC